MIRKVHPPALLQSIDSPEQVFMESPPLENARAIDALRIDLAI